MTWFVGYFNSVALFFNVGCIDFIVVYKYDLLTFCVVLLFVLACYFVVVWYMLFAFKGAKYCCYLGALLGG